MATFGGTEGGQPVSVCVVLTLVDPPLPAAVSVELTENGGRE